MYTSAYAHHQLPGAMLSASWWQVQLDVLHEYLSFLRPQAARHLEGGAFRLRIEVAARRRTLMAALLRVYPLETGDTLRHQGGGDGVENGQDPAQAADGHDRWNPPPQTPWRWNGAKQINHEGVHGYVLPRDPVNLSAERAAATVASLIVNLWAEGCVLLGDCISDALRFITHHLHLWIASIDGARDRARNNRHSPLQPSAAGEPGSAIWVRHLSNEHEVIRPISAICNGDVIVVGTGEMIPLSGTVTDGSAWLRHFPHAADGSARLGAAAGRLGSWGRSTGDQTHGKETPTDSMPTNYMLVTIGQQIPAFCIVEVGRLHIGVEFN